MVEAQAPADLYRGRQGNMSNLIAWADRYAASGERTIAEIERDRAAGIPDPPPIDHTLTATSTGSNPSVRKSPFVASAHASDGKAHLLLACTGSVATIKLPNILHALSSHPRLSIRLVLTPSATQFLAGQSHEQPPLSSLLNIPNVDGIHLDADEWDPPWTRGSPILHIELRRWANLMVIAPLSADAMAKIVGGWSEGLVFSVVRAWDTDGVVDGKKKRIIVAPAMNTAMWRQPVTQKHLEILEGEWGVEHGGWIEVLRPVEKTLACGDSGTGAMREWKEIVGVVEERLGLMAE